MTRFAANAASGASSRPEIQLLLCCARARLDPERADQLKALLQQDLDWAYLLRMAHRHGLLPFLYWHLNAVAPEATPQRCLDDLRAYFHAKAQRNLYLTSRLLNILEVLEGGGVRAVPFKGPALAASLYGNLALRKFADLDLLLREQDVQRAQELLIAQGYCASHPAGRKRKPAAWQRPGQYVLTGDDGMTLVELHSEVTLRYFPNQVDLEPVWQRLESISLGGKQLPSLCPEDLLIFLCVHGAKDFWEEFRWVCDIAELIQGPRELNWPWLLEEAGRLGCARILFLGLLLASDLLGAALPDSVSQQARADPAVASLEAKVRAQLFSDTPSEFSLPERFLFRLRMVPQFWAGLRYCYRLATSPTEEDWAPAGWPTPLSGALSRVLRPFRLLTTYGLGLLPRAEDVYLSEFEPTPMEIVDRMLELAELRSTDIIYDLGSGDGRIVIQAAKRYLAQGVGVEIDRKRIAEAKRNAQKEGVQHLVTFLRQDAMRVNLSRATVVTIYLIWPPQLRLCPRLREQLRPGTRVVARDSSLGDWLPERTEVVETSAGTRSTLYLWRVK